MRESMRDTQSKMASDSSNEGTTDKPVVLGNGKRENGENYQRALTLLNEAVGILTSPGSAADTSQHQPQLSQQSSPASLTVQVSGSSESREMAQLFPFYRQGAAAGARISFRQPYKRFRPSASSSGRKKAWKPKETWTHTFVCIAEADHWLIPLREEKIVLKEAGLGEKKITFDKYGDYEHFQSSLLKEFPKLKEGGGFQVLRSSGARRCLDLIPIPTMGYDIPYLKECLGQAIAYVRPLQKDLDRSPLPVQESKPDGLENAPKVTCLNCKDQVPLTSWEDHDKSCCGGTSKQADSEYEVLRVEKDGDVIQAPIVQRNSGNLNTEPSVKVCCTQAVTKTADNTSSKEERHPTDEFLAAPVSGKNFDGMLSEILGVIPDANEQDVRKKLLATGSVEETLDWMLEQQNTFYQQSVLSKALDPHEALEAFRKATVLKLPYETIRINRNSKHFIRDVFKLFKKGVCRESVVALRVTSLVTCLASS